VPIQWEIEVAPGQIARLNGTVQEVYAQALQINPNFKLKTPSTPARPRRALAHQRSKVEDCNYPYPLAEASKIHDGVEYLRGVPGKPVEGPGPTACGRVSCSWKSAIWWCNDVSLVHDPHSPYHIWLGSAAARLRRVEHIHY
jgi:hypothetical protein